jgi:glycosyltransferase involved in cell wall biosynthesis
MSVKILISAYACAPNRGSEPGVGWNWSVLAARHGHEVHVVTQVQARPAIVAEITRQPVKGLHYHFMELPKMLFDLKYVWGNYSQLLYYYLWQIALLKKARKLHREITFDLCHHVTFVMDWMPSGLCRLGIPFLWGPVGGSTHLVPNQIRMDWPRYAVRHERWRAILQSFVQNLDPFTKMTMERASKILTYTEEAIGGIPPQYRTKTEPIVHIGIWPQDLPQSYLRSEQFDPTIPFTILTGGRLVHWKGFDLLLAGFAKFVHMGEERARLLITGTGPYESKLKSLRKELGIENNVEFLGHLASRNCLYETMQDCDLYALPTLRDGPPVGIIEAMFAGLPVLCLDIGATSELVPSHLGFLIPVKSRKQIIEDIANTLINASRNRAELRRRGQESKAHVQRVHDWNRIGDQADELYRHLIPDSPDELPI